MTVTAPVRTRPDRADLVVALAAVAAFVVIAWLGRGLTFFADEWAVIEDRPIGLETFLRPFNEHWLGVQTLVYRALFELVGLRTYVPYHLFLVALHVVVALEVYALARRSTRAGVAAAIAVVVLFFGGGFENLYWAMQIGFAGAIALGLGALLVLDVERVSPARVALATALLTIGVMTSGFGLFMLAFVGLDLLADPRRRRWVLALAVPAGIYLAWYVALGRSGVATMGNPFSPEAILATPAFVLRGAAAAFGSAVGVGPVVGYAVVAVVVGLVVWRMVTGRGVPPRALAALGAIVAMYGLVGLVRSQLEVDATQYTRYTYLSGMFALVALAALVGRPALPVERPARLAAVSAVAVVVGLSLTWNVTLLVSGRALFAERAALTRAFVELGLGDELPPGVAPHRNLILVPSPDALRAIVAGYGSPLTDALAPDAVGPITDEARAEALVRAQHPPAWLLAQEAARGR